MKHKFIIISFCILLAGCMFEEVFSPLDNELSSLIVDPAKYLLPSETDYSNIPQSPENPLTKEKVELGNLLFFEPAFSIEPKHYQSLNTYTCASCHVPEKGFRPGRFQGIADGGVGFGNFGDGRTKNGIYDDSEIDAQGARPLAVLNTAFVTNSMWNGSFGSKGVNIGTEDQWGVSDPGTARNNTHYGSLESQNIEGLITHRMKYTEERIKAFGYKKMFDAAFPEMPIEQRYSNEAASFALSAYLRALLTNQAPFQKWLKGDKNAMTEQQKSGAIVFFGKAGCVRCHSEPNLGSINFAAVGVKDLFENGGLKTDINDLRNKGRGGFTNKVEDYYKFRVPQLYNLGDGGPYFHGSSKQTLKEVVEYFNDAVPENGRVPASQLSPFFKPLNLSEVEKEQLVAFLKDGLRDANLKRYVPERVNSGMCFPNNDYQSKEDMGCH